MALIPLTEKFIGLSQDVDTVNKRSAIINAESQAYTMQDVVDTVEANIQSNPSVIGIAATNGTAVTGTFDQTISRAIAIPAGTFEGGSGMLEFMARFKKTGTAGDLNVTVYLSLSATSLVGANIIATFQQANINNGQGIRTARISGGALTVYNPFAASLTDYVSTATAPSSLTFSVDLQYYLLFVIQLGDDTDSAVIEMARAVKY